jgi:biotin-(acetyl-CoA carboxylase) ligase
MKILLDIDDTSLILKDGSTNYQEHPRLSELIETHQVFLYSGNTEIEKYYKKWKTKGYISKSADEYPKADVLIDNECNLWKDFVTVKKAYYSIDEFFEKESIK